MTEPLAYLNGQLVPASEMRISASDTGFVMGVTVAEQLRSFNGRLFRLDQHLQRLAHSLDIIGLQPDVSMAQLEQAAQSLAVANHKLLGAGDDLGLTIFVTPGDYPTYSPRGPHRPTVGMHTYPVPFCLWAEKYVSGQAMVVTAVRQVPPECWPAELKCRSRMHYYLADRYARQQDPQARALILDAGGLVSEASTANVVAHLPGEGLVSPPQQKILPGISLGVLSALAAAQDIPLVYRNLAPVELHTADELLLTSTSPCLLPVVRLDGRPIGSGEPGHVFRQLLSDWSDLVAVDIPKQARQFADR